MKGYIFKRFVAAAIAAMPVFFVSSCKENPVPPLPEIELGSENMEFGFEGGSDTVTLYVNRDWQAITDADWIAIDDNGCGLDCNRPSSGKQRRARDGHGA